MRHQNTKMNRNLRIGFLALLAFAHAHTVDSSRWSRQISGYFSDISDWVPLTKPIERIPEQPIKRQAVAQPRILSDPFPGFTRPTGFQENFQSGSFYQNQGNRPLYLQSVPSASQNYLTDQGFGQQSIRLALGTPQFPLSQGFVAPSYSFDNVQSRPDAHQRFPQLQQGALPNPVKFEQFQKQNGPAQFGPGKIQPPPSAPPVQKPAFSTIQSQKRPDIPKFIDGYRIENSSQDYNVKKRPQSLQKLKMDSIPQFESFNQRNEKTSEMFQSRPLKPTNIEREEVQLLYVPVDSLNRGQFSYKTVPSAQSLNRDLFSSPAIQRPDVISQNFPPSNQRPQIQRPQQGGQAINQDYLHSYNSQNFGSNQNQSPRLQAFATSPAAPFPGIATTPKPKKLKPHQPPLAVYMVQESKKGDGIKVADVLSTLKTARNIAVLDSVSPANSPKVFIGPSSLSPPENYVKFELPYLSNLENTDRKLRQLPFFVAPLSYSTPEGFAKIPFPSPHVGSVIVNSLLKDSNSSPFATSTPYADVFPNSYTAGTPAFQTEKQPQFTNAVTTKPTFSYFSTVPPRTPSTQDPFQSQFFSFEPQGVKSIKPQDTEQNIITAPPARPLLFPSSNSNFNLPSQNFNTQHNYQENQSTFPPSATAYNIIRGEHLNNKLNNDRPSSIAPLTATQTAPTTRFTTPKAPSTFPNHLLETHNPFSINQAFEFSSPVDYHNIYEDNKTDISTPSITSLTPKIPHTPPELSTQQGNIRPSSPNYLQNYSPEIHYQTEILSSRFPSFDVNNYPSSTESQTEKDIPSQRSPVSDFSSEKVKESSTPGSYHESAEVTKTSEFYNQYSDSKDFTRDNSAAPSSTTSTTTRRPLRTRGRPRYTTPKEEINESSTRTPVTRRPLRERKPLPSRNRYETSSKPSTERSTPTRHQPEFSSTTESSAYKTTRLRTRGRLHFKPTEHPDELYDISKKSKSKKEEDNIAYQRDVLHQNYPVTLMERMSTADVEAITSPSPRISSTRFLSREPSTETFISQDSFLTERPQSIRLNTFDESPIKEVEPPTYTSRSTNVQTEATYVPRFSATINEEPSFHSRSSTNRYEEPIVEPRPSNSRNENNSYSSRSSTSQSSIETTESVTTEASRLSSYQYSDFDLTEKLNAAIEESSTVSNSDKSLNIESHVKISENNKINDEHNFEEGTHEINTVIPTATNYRNKPRNRPLPSRQHPASTSSTTEVSTTTAHKVTRLEVKRRPIQPVTYRPAYDRRRTTMRIEEIESELKTKQIHSRPEEIPEKRHPVYKPEPTTEPSPVSFTTETIKKTSNYRRRRPQSNASSVTPTETPVQAEKKPTYEIKNRFRGRRPTTEKPTVIRGDREDSTVPTTIKTPSYNRYNHRARVPESRFNKKPVSIKSMAESDEDSEQDADYSVHRPKIVPFDEQPSEDRAWSPNLSTNSFKPYNPNDLQENSKSVNSNEYGIKFNDSNPEVDIITIRNDNDNFFLSVTPASNRLNKKIPDIPPTLEAFVEQSKNTTIGNETISTIESVIEEMMKSLEEQDEDEYTRNVMKHEGGEIGEIPPEKVITSGETSSAKRGQRLEPETETTDASNNQETHNSNQETEKDRKGRRRGYWKKVKVRPVTTESFEVAESQFYTNTVNHLGEEEKPSINKRNKETKESTYIRNPLTTQIVDVKGSSSEAEATTILSQLPEEVKVSDSSDKQTYTNISAANSESQSFDDIVENIPQSTFVPPSPGDLDLGTGSPDPTIMDMIYEYNTRPTEANSGDKSGTSILENTKDFTGVMDYLFGFTATGVERDQTEGTEDDLATTKDTVISTEKGEKHSEKSQVTERSNGKQTTESSFFPAEFTESLTPDEEKKTEEMIAEQFESIRKNNVTTESSHQTEVVLSEDTQSSKIAQFSTESSFWDPALVISTSMSTEISHETEICFRGKCIKTSKDLK